jgi:Major tropism determinant N-terminal domain
LAHTQVQRARGTSAQNLAYTGPAGELTVNTDDWTLRVHDGATPGGWPLRAIGANYSYQQPTTGTTLTAAAHLGAYLIDPLGPLAALTIVVPSAPNDGDEFLVVTTQPIGAGGLGTNGAVRWQYRSANSTWYRNGGINHSADAFAKTLALSPFGAI